MDIRVIYRIADRGKTGYEFKVLDRSFLKRVGGEDVYKIEVTGDSIIRIREASRDDYFSYGDVTTLFEDTEGILSICEEAFEKGEVEDKTEEILNYYGNVGMW